MEANKRLPQANPAYAAPVVLKTIKVISTIVKTGQNPGISEIASELRLAKSTTHGILAALEQSGWVLRDPVTRKYTCGHVLQELGARAHIRLPLVDTARPFLQKIGDELDEDVFLGMFTPHYLLILDQVESSKRLKVSTRPGTRLPIFAGAAGKIFLAHYDRAMVEELVRTTDIPAFTPLSTTDPNQYLQELEQVRNDGVALDRGEYIADVRAVAAPVFHGSRTRRRIVAGVWVVGFSAGFDEQKMQRAAELVRQCCDEISHHLSR